jgi:hypothetical protein
VRLAKVIETAKELKHHPVVIDVSKVTLSEITIDKRKEKRASVKKSLEERPRRESVSKKKLRRILSTHHANRPRRSLFHPDSKTKVFVCRDETRHNSNTISQTKQSYDHLDTPSNVNLISDGVRNPKIILNNCNLNVFNVTNNYQVLNTQQLTENFNTQENLKTVENFDTLKTKEDRDLYFEDNLQDDTINTDIYFSSYYNDIVENNEEFSYVEQIRHEHIDILDEEEKIKIENQTYSEREIDYYCNPLQRELDAFLEKNAIDVAELIEDKSLILIDEKENTYNNHFPKKLMKKFSLIRTVTKKSLDDINVFCDQSPEKNKIKNEGIISYPDNRILKSPTNKKHSYVPQNKVFKLENNFSDFSDFNRFKLRNSNTLKSSVNKLDNILEEEIEIKSKIPVPIKSKLLRKSTYSNDKIIMNDSYTKNMRNKLMKKFSINDVIKEQEDDFKIEEKNNISSSLSKSHFSSSCDSVPIKNFGTIKTEEFFLTDNQEIENFERLGTRKDTFSSLTVKTPSTSFKGSFNYRKKIQKKNSVILKKNKMKKKIVKEPEVHQSLEDTLNSKLTSKLVVLIMFLMVVFPILDPDYINIIFGSSEDDATVESFCVNSLDDAFLKSIQNQTYLPVLQKYWLNCLDIAEEGSSIKESNNTLNPFFLFFNFTNYMPYYQLKKILEEKQINLTSLPEEIYSHPYYDYLAQHKRSNLNYKKKIFDNGDSFNSTIKFVFNNNVTMNVESLLNILKIVFIAMFLITGALIFSNDIHYFVIIPLDKVMIRLKLYLNNTDTLNEEVDIENLDKMDLQSAYKKALLVLDKKGQDEKISYKKNETNAIDKNTMVLINLISISIGKPSKKNKLIISFLFMF